MHPPKTGSLSNTIAFEAHLIDRGVPSVVAQAICMDIGRMAEKIVFGSAYTLLNEQQLEEPVIQRVGGHAILAPAGTAAPTYKQILAGSLSKIVKADVEIDYVGTTDLCQSTRDESRKAQMLVYLMTRDTPIRKALGLEAGTRRTRGPADKDLDYALREEIKLAIGTHKLRRILDERFGNPFSKILKDNLIDLWYGYCNALIKNDLIASEYAKLCEIQRVALIVGCRNGDLKKWVVFVHRNKAKPIT